MPFVALSVRPGELAPAVLLVRLILALVDHQPTWMLPHHAARTRETTVLKLSCVLPAVRPRLVPAPVHPAVAPLPQSGGGQRPQATEAVITMRIDNLPSVSAVVGCDLPVILVERIDQDILVIEAQALLPCFSLAKLSLLAQGAAPRRRLWSSQILRHGEAVPFQARVSMVLRTIFRRAPALAPGPTVRRSTLFLFQSRSAEAMRPSACQTGGRAQLSLVLGIALPRVHQVRLNRFSLGKAEALEFCEALAARLTATLAMQRLAHLSGREVPRRAS
mmetsp:Transcript_96168/g.206339  ORF Transcript_96168/g.206339 Transcript_96168/m.206339 type:complete len:276 (+) Transcript_96168:196-1023(+)